MAGQEKEIGRQELENALKMQFSDSNQIENLLDEVYNVMPSAEKNAEENTLFFAEFLKAVKKSTSIAEWTGAEGISKITGLSVKVKKEVDQKRRKEQEDNKKREEEQQYQEFQDKEAQDEIVKQELEKIDFDNLKLEDLQYIAANWDNAIQNLDYKKLEKHIETASEFLGTDNELSQIIKLSVKKQKGQLSIEEEQQLSETLKANDMTEQECKISEKIQQQLIDKCVERIHKNGELTLTDIEEICAGLPATCRNLLQKHPNLIDREKILENSRDSSFLQKQGNGQKYSTEKENLEDTLKKQDNMSLSNTDLAKENDEMMSIMMSMQRDFATIEDRTDEIENSVQEEMDKTDNTVINLKDKEIIGTQYAEYQQNNENITQEPLQEEMETFEQEQYRYETTFEVKEGFFANIVSKLKSFIPKGIQERLATKDKSEQLPAGKAEITRENGIRQASYYGNGTLEPSLLKRLQSKSIEIAGNVMNAISKVAKISSQNENEVKNAPIVVSSKTQGEVQQTQQFQEQAVIETARTSENANRMNAFDEKYSIHSQKSEFYMTDEQIAKAKIEAEISDKSTDEAKIEQVDGVRDDDDFMSL